MNNWSWACGIWWVGGAKVWLLTIFYILIAFYELPPPNFETSSWLNWLNNLINPVYFTVVPRLFTVVPRLFTACCSTAHTQPHMYVRKISEDGSIMSDSNSAEYLPVYTALLHRKRQTLGTEVSGPSFTPDRLVSLAISRNFVKCESELCLLFWPTEAWSSREVLKVAVANG
jgi:hypothetical protein